MARVRIPDPDSLVYAAAEMLAARPDADVRLTGGRLRAEGLGREVRRLATRLRMLADPRLRSSAIPAQPHLRAPALVWFRLDHDRDYLGAEPLTSAVQAHVPLQRMLPDGLPSARETIVLATTLMTPDDHDGLVEQLIAADAVIPLLMAGDVVVHGRVGVETVLQLVRTLAGHGMWHSRQIGELLEKIAPLYGERVFEALAEGGDRDFLAAAGKWVPEPAVAALVEQAGWGRDGDRQSILQALVAIGTRQPVPAIRAMIQVGRIGNDFTKGLTAVAFAAMPLPGDGRDVLGAQSPVRAELVEYLAALIPAESFPKIAPDVLPFLLPLLVMCAAARVGMFAAAEDVARIAAPLATVCANELRRQGRAPIAAAALDALTATLLEGRDAHGAASDLANLIAAQNRRRSRWLAEEEQDSPPAAAAFDARDPIPWLYEVVWERLLACIRDEYKQTMLVIPEELETPAPEPPRKTYEKRPLPDRIRGVRLDDLVALAGEEYDPGKQRDALDAANALAAEYPLESLPLLADYAAVDDRYGGGSFRTALDHLIRDYPDEARRVLTDGLTLPGGTGRWRPQDHPSRQVRVRIAKVAQDLGKTYPRDALRILRELLHDPDDNIRVWAGRSREAILALHGGSLEER